MAALDGVKHSTDPGPAVVKENIYEMDAAKRKALGIKTLPGSLSDALDALESDSGFLRPVFTSSTVQAYVDLKRAEIKRLGPLKPRISAKEFQEYQDL
jgi:glutamine synthetase